MNPNRLGEETQINAVLRRSEAQQKHMQARIDSQKMSIDRLLKARESEPEDTELIAAMLVERVALQTTCLTLKGMLDELDRIMGHGTMDAAHQKDAVLAVLRTYAETKDRSVNESAV
jgi:hypothetical protein